MRRSFATISTFTLSCAAVLSATAASAGPAGSPEDTGTVGDRNGGLSWTTLNCPPGEIAAGVKLNQGGWTAKITLMCAAPTRTGGWASAPAESGSAGGDHGTHEATLSCPRDRWIAGMSGQQVGVNYVGGLVSRQFLANPIIYCGGPNTPGTTAVSDPQFVPEQKTNMTSPVYVDSPAQYCNKGSYASSLKAAVETKHLPDIKAVRMQCAPVAGLRPPPN